MNRSKDTGSFSATTLFLYPTAVSDSSVQRTYHNPARKDVDLLQPINKAQALM